MKKEDINSIKEFSKQFESKISKLLSLKPYKVNEFREYLKYGAETIYIIPKPKDFKQTKWRKDPKEGMLWISTGINPNGVLSKYDIDRTYTISFKQMCSQRRKYGREWYEGDIEHFYNYGRTIDEVLSRFEEYLNKAK